VFFLWILDPLEKDFFDELFDILCRFIENTPEKSPDYQGKKDWCHLEQLHQVLNCSGRKSSFRRFTWNVACGDGRGT